LLGGALLALGGVWPRRAAAQLLLAYPDDNDDPLWQSDGICRQLLQHVIARAAELDLAFLALPWLRAQRMVAQGEADALLCPRSIARNGFMLFAETPVIELGSCWLVRREDPRFVAAAPELVPELVVLKVLGDEMPRTRLMADARSTFAPDHRSLFTMIAQGRADIAPILELRGHHLLRRLGLGEKLSLLPAGQRSALYFGIRRGYPDAAALVGAADEAIMRSRADGTIDHMHRTALNAAIHDH
jgi:polar amino acid transport system substrate-binding protein